jgi:Ulp1 family protease
MNGLITLEDCGWLTAEVIDVYLEQICRSHNNVQYIPNDAILTFRSKKKSIRSPWYWPTNGIETVLMPANITENHWGLCVMNIPGRTIQYFDSRKSTRKDTRDDIADYLELFWFEQIFNL